MKDFKKNDVGMPIWAPLAYLLTLGVWMFIGYSVTNERKYYLNRKLLIKLLKKSWKKMQEEKSLREFGMYDINVYSFIYNNKKYEIHHYLEDHKITLSSDREFDLIGLFDLDKISKWQNKQIIKHIKNIKTYNHEISNDFFKNLEEFKKTEIHDHTIVSPIYTKIHI